MSKARATKKRRRRAPDASDPRGSSSKVAPADRVARFEVRDTRSPGGSQGAGGVARPQAIWAPFPLTEIGMAVGLVLFLAGFATGGARGAWLLGIGVVMLCVVVAELCLREHFAGQL